MTHIGLKLKQICEEVVVKIDKLCNVLYCYITVRVLHNMPCEQVSGKPNFALIRMDVYLHWQSI